jgi:hypothetical protein
MPPRKKRTMTTPYTIDIALLCSSSPSRKNHLRDTFYHMGVDFTPTELNLPDDAFYKQLNREMINRSWRTKSAFFVHHVNEYNQIFGILKKKYASPETPRPTATTSTHHCYNNFTLSNDQSHLVVFKENDASCHLKKCLFADELFEKLFELFTTKYRDAFMRCKPDVVFMKIHRDIDYAVLKAWVQRFSDVANTTAVLYNPPPTISTNSIPCAGYNPPINNDFIPTPYYPPINNFVLPSNPAFLNHHFIPPCFNPPINHNFTPPVVAAGGPAKEDMPRDQNLQQQIDKVNQIKKERDETEVKFKLEIATLQRQVQEKIKVIAHSQAKQQLLEKEKAELSQQNKQQQVVITNVMTQRDDAKDKHSSEAATMWRGVQEQAKDIKILLAKLNTLKKDKDDLMRQNKQQKYDIAKQIQLRDELQTSSDAQIASLRSIISDYERKKQQHQQTQHDNTPLNVVVVDCTQSNNPLLHHAGPIDEVVVTDAGTPEVNGVYSHDGYSGNAFRYSRRGSWKGKTCSFYILQCEASDNQNYWYITIVPSGCSPGTMDDIDFYAAPVSEERRGMPPLNGWVRDDQGSGHPPTLSYRMSKQYSGEQRNGSHSATHQADVSETQNRESSEKWQAMEQEKQAWTQRNELLMEKNKRLRADLDEIIQQHDEKDKKSKAEIDSLRTTIDAYECKARARHKSRIQGLREKAERYE